MGKKEKACQNAYVPEPQQDSEKREKRKVRMSLTQHISVVEESPTGPILNKHLNDNNSD